MNDTTRTAQQHHADDAAAFRALHSRSVLVLPNAWDALSAAIVQDAGAAAVATTSAGISWSLGYPDGQRAPWSESLRQIERIAAVTRVPLTVDIEGGHSDVAAVVAQVIAAGAVGINIEDGDVDGLLPAEAMAERIMTARTTAREAGVDLFVNARTDPYLIGAADQRATAIARAMDYLAAGADGIFVPGVTDLEEVHSLARAIPAPLNIMVAADAPSVDQLRRAGARRISTGMAITQAMADLTRRITMDLLSSGTTASMRHAMPFAELDRLFATA